MIIIDSSIVYIMMSVSIHEPGTTCVYEPIIIIIIDIIIYLVVSVNDETTIETDNKIDNMMLPIISNTVNSTSFIYLTRI